MKVSSAMISVVTTDWSELSTEKLSVEFQSLTNPFKLRLYSMLRGVVLAPIGIKNSDISTCIAAAGRAERIVMMRARKRCPGRARSVGQAALAMGGLCNGLPIV
ncbi:hypothetical protein [uncultured Duncaniella sp.]|nr:hypothetical protein [uncultured Duncaniella sp.]